MAVWDHSMDGVPWTPSKMRRAVKILREGASVSFAFGAEPLDRLAVLDEKVLRLRPDLVLHVWSTAAGSGLDDEQVASLAALQHLRHLKVTGVKRARLAPLAALRTLESIDLGLGCNLDPAFLVPLSKLRKVRLRAKVVDLGPLAELARLESLELGGTLGELEPLGGCARLSSLRFGSTTIGSLEFLSKLSKLRELALDSATIAGPLDGIGEARGLTGLSLTSNKNLRDLDFIARLTRLERLRIDQPLVLTLPDLAKLSKLTDIALGGMKAWTNPEVLETLPRVRHVELKEINPKLAADRFFFLADSRKLRSLEKVDVRWIDFAKRRREALQAHFVAAGRAALLA